MQLENIRKQSASKLCESDSKGKFIESLCSSSGLFKEITYDRFEVKHICYSGAC